MEANTKNRRCSSLASGGFAITRKVPTLLGDEGDGEPACGSRRHGSVLHETERLPSAKGGKRTLTSGIRPKPRTTASTGAVCTDTRNFF